MTERTVAKQSIVDDDAISINSTEIEDYSENDNFEVERIMAEKVIGNGRKLYLIAWLGYPEWKSTWEPRKHIHDRAIIDTWKERKLREERKIELPYDVARFEAMVSRLASEKANRHQRRQAKRKRLGLAVSPSENSPQPSDDSQSSVEATEVDEKPEDDPGMKRTRTRSSQSPVKKPKKPFKVTVRGGHTPPMVESSDEDVSLKIRRETPGNPASSKSAVPALENDLAKENIKPKPYDETAHPAPAKLLEKPKHARIESDASCDTPKANKRSRTESPPRQGSSSASIPLAKRRQQVSFAPEPPSTTSQSTAPTKDPPHLGQFAGGRGRSSTTGVSSTRGGGATRGGPSLGGTRKPRNLLTTSSDPKNAPKIFGSMRIRRRAELQGRAIADAAPDLAAIGGLFDPSRPSTYQQFRPADVRKSKARDGEYDMGLFVDSDEPVEPGHDNRKSTVLGAFKAPPYQAPSKGPPPDPSRATCFFWHRGQLDPSKGDCGKKDKCEFIHGYERDVPIANPPEGFVDYTDELRQTSIDLDRRNSLPEDALGKDIAPPWRTGNSKTRLTCFFWDRAQRLPDNIGCGKKDACLFLHHYEPNVEVAPQPVGFIDHGIAEPDGSLQLVDRQDSMDVSRRGPLVPPKDDPELETQVSWQNLDPNRATCYYWDRGQIDASMGTCTKGASCKFIHAYEKGLRIARPPGERSDMRADTRWPDPVNETASVLPPRRKEPDVERMTCYWWDLNLKRNGEGTCTKGVSCKYLHYYGEGIQVAPIPYTNSRAGRDSSFHDRHIPSNEHRNQGDTRIAENTHSPDSSTRPPWQKDSVDKESSKPTIEPPPSRPHYDENNPFHAICYQWRDSGSCPTREICPFFHTNSPGIPLAPKPVESRLNIAVSILSESEHYRRALAVPQFTKASSIPPMHRKSDPYYSTCYYWAQNHTCRNGHKCRYLHAYEDGVPLAPAPPTIHDKKLETCRFWVIGDCYRTAEECEYLHGYPPVVTGTEMGGKGPDDKLASLARPVAPRKSVSFAVDEPVPSFNESESSLSPMKDSKDQRDDEDPHITRWKLDAGICFHFSKGDCWHGAACHFKHELAPGESAVSIKPSRIQIESQRKVSFAPSHYTTFDNRGLTDLENKNQLEPQPGMVSRQDQLPIAQSPIMQSPIVQSPIEQSHLDKFPSPQLGPAGFQIPKVKRAKISYEDHRRKNVFNALGTRAKEFTFGSGEAQSVIVDFGDLSQVQHYPWAQQLSALSKFRFDQICIAQDLAKQFSSLLREGLWQGNVVPADPTDAAAQKTIDMVVDEMRIRSSGLISVCPDFVILTYPKTPEWDFVETSNDGQKDVRLRFLIFRCNLDIRKPIKLRPTVTVDSNAAEPVPHRKILMKAIHGLRFKDILPIYKKDKQNPLNFFLLFPSPAYETLNFLISWLHSSCKGGKVYSSQDEGSWDFFINSTNSESGVVFIHESVAAEIYRFPCFQEIVKKNIVFWFISDSSRPYPMYPSNHGILESAKPGQITATRLFPHGHVFLLTPSFVVAEPRRVCEILEWFFGRARQPATDRTPEITKKLGKFDGSTAGTWKLLACHNFANYVLDLANSKAAEKKAFELENPDKPSIEQMLEDKGLDFLTCKLRYNIHAKLVELESRNILKFSSDDYDSDFPDEQYSPIIYADRDIDPDNEPSLVEWFAAWSLRKLDMYRKFTVVGTGSKSIKRATRIKEVHSGGALRSNQLEEIALVNFKSFSLSKKVGQLPAADVQSPSKSPMGPRQKGLAVAANLSSTHTKSPPSSSKTVERNPFDETNKANATNHGIDQLHPDALKFVAVTGASANEAKNILSQSNNDVRRAVDFHESRDDTMDIESQVLELIGSSRSEPAAQLLNLPRLATADADMARAKEILHAPGVSAPPFSSITSRTPTTEQSFSPKMDRTLDGGDGYFTGQFDSVDDERLGSSASDSSIKLRSGIQTDDNGQRLVPRSVRPSGSIRKEILVKPGYVPPEDREFYRNRRVVNGFPKYEVSSNGSNKASPASPQPMDIDSAAMSKSSSMTGSDGGVWKESGREVKMKEIRFEPTTVWYRRLKENGGGYEHLYVESWEKAFMNLGMYPAKK